MLIFAFTYSATHQILFYSSIQLSAAYSPQSNRVELNHRTLLPGAIIISATGANCDIDRRLGAVNRPHVFFTGGDVCRRTLLSARIRENANLLRRVDWRLLRVYFEYTCRACESGSVGV